MSLLGFGALVLSSTPRERFPYDGSRDWERKHRRRSHLSVVRSRKGVDRRNFRLGTTESAARFMSRLLLRPSGDFRSSLRDHAILPSGANAQENPSRTFCCDDEREIQRELNAQISILLDYYDMSYFFSILSHTYIHTYNAQCQHASRRAFRFLRVFYIPYTLNPNFEKESVESNTSIIPV